MCAAAYASSAASDDSSEMSPAPAAPRQEQTQACPDRSSTHLTFLERWREGHETHHYPGHASALVTPGRPTSRRQRCLTHFGAAPTNNPHPPINLETSPVTTDRRGTPPLCTSIRAPNGITCNRWVLPSSHETYVLVSYLLSLFPSRELFLLVPHLVILGRALLFFFESQRWMAEVGNSDAAATASLRTSRPVFACSYVAVQG